jgi:hypothetical protein
MKRFENTILIYPEDPTIDFLQLIFEKIKILFPEIIIFRPKYGALLDTMIDDNTQLVLFLGHGSPSGLYGGANENGDKQMLCTSIPRSASLLQGCSIVLFSCNSNDYLEKLIRNEGQINNYIVFGDMPTDWEHIKHNRDNDARFWTECDEAQLNYYKSSLVESIISGFEKACKMHSFYGFSKGVGDALYKKVNDIILKHDFWKKNQKLQLIERLIEFKKDLRCNETI